MRHISVSLYLLWGAVVAVAACSAPDADDARRWYDRHKVTIDRIDNAIDVGVVRDPKVPRLNLDVLPALFVLPGVIGIKVTYHPPGNTGRLVLGEIGATPPGYKKGRAAAKDGTSVDDRMLGWGEYQTMVENSCGKFGDGAARAGIEVAWDRREGDVTIHVEVNILAEDTVDDIWRAGTLCHSP